MLVRLQRVPVVLCRAPSWSITNALRSTDRCQGVQGGVSILFGDSKRRSVDSVSVIKSCTTSHGSHRAMSVFSAVFLCVLVRSSSTLMIEYWNRFLLRYNRKGWLCMSCLLSVIMPIISCVMSITNVTEGMESSTISFSFR